MPETTKGKLGLALKAVGVALGAGVVAAVTQAGIDQTALVALPPAAKITLAIAAPVIKAWLADSPKDKSNGG